MSYVNNHNNAELNEFSRISDSVTFEEVSKSSMVDVAKADKDHVNTYGTHSLGFINAGIWRLNGQQSSYRPRNGLIENFCEAQKVYNGGC